MANAYPAARGDRLAPMALEDLTDKGQFAMVLL
jgi:hypothetical protein